MNGRALTLADVPTRWHRLQPRVLVTAGRWIGRTGWAVGAEDTRPWSNGGLVVVVRLAPTDRAAAREVRVRLGSLLHMEAKP